MVGLNVYGASRAAFFNHRVGAGISGKRGGVFPAGVGELLNRLDGVVEQDLLPAAEVGQGPVAINTLDAGDAVFGNFFEQAFDDGGGGVVGVDQHGEVLLLPRRLGFAGHGSSLNAYGSNILRMLAMRHSDGISALSNRG